MTWIITFQEFRQLLKLHILSLFCMFWEFTYDGSSFVWIFVLISSNFFYRQVIICQRKKKELISTNVVWFHFLMLLYPCCLLYGILYHWGQQKNVEHMFCTTGMTSLGVPLNTFLFTVVLSIMTIIIMLEDKAKATLLQCSPTVITFMELTRYYKIFSTNLFWYVHC